jgi:hypothetical protein
MDQRLVDVRQGLLIPLQPLGGPLEVLEKASAPGPRRSAPAGSYTARLAEAKTPAEAAHETADVLYFTLAALARHGVDLATVEAELDRRALKVTRRD